MEAHRWFCACQQRSLGSPRLNIPSCILRSSSIPISLPLLSSFFVSQAQVSIPISFSQVQHLQTSSQCAESKLKNMSRYTHSSLNTNTSATNPISPGTTRPNNNQPPRPYSTPRSVPNLHSRHCNQFLRPPPDPWEIPTPTSPPLDLRLRIRRHNPLLPFPLIKIQTGRSSLRSFARRVCHQSLRERRVPKACP